MLHALFQPGSLPGSTSKNGVQGVVKAQPNESKKRQSHSMHNRCDTLRVFFNLQ